MNPNPDFTPNPHSSLPLPPTLPRWGGTPLSDAIREGHTKVARALKFMGGGLNWTEDKAAGELCEMARAGDIERLQLLLDVGCNVNAADYDARTCVHLAASVGNLRIVEVLRQHGADVNAKDRYAALPEPNPSPNPFNLHPKS